MLLTILLSTFALVQKPAARHVIYVHGKAVEDGGRRPNTRFGIYEYDAILRALRQRGFTVTSEQRPRNADPDVYAKRVANEVRALMRNGVPPSHITVIGASKGAVITMLASTQLQQRDVRYVLLGNCNDAVFESRATRLSGHVLSIYEESDTFGHTCDRFFARAGALAEHHEIALHLGIGHAFLYSPRADWLEPAARWVEELPPPPHGEVSRETAPPHTAPAVLGCAGGGIEMLNGLFLSRRGALRVRADLRVCQAATRAISRWAQTTPSHR